MGFARARPVRRLLPDVSRSSHLRAYNQKVTRGSRYDRSRLTSYAGATDDQSPASRPTVWARRRLMSGIVSLHGKKGLIVGVANEHSIASGCAEVMRGAGADLAATYLSAKAEPWVRRLAEQLASTTANRVSSRPCSPASVTTGAVWTSAGAGMRSYARASPGRHRGCRQCCGLPCQRRSRRHHRERRVHDAGYHIVT